jgi:hypothetical protein
MGKRSSFSDSFLEADRTRVLSEFAREMLRDCTLFHQGHQNASLHRIGGGTHHGGRRSR